MQQVNSRPILTRTFFTGARTPPVVQVFDAATGALKYKIANLPPSFQNGLRFITLGAVNNDGVTELVLLSNHSRHGAPVQVNDGATGACCIRSSASASPSRAGRRWPFAISTAMASPTSLCVRGSMASGAYVRSAAAISCGWMGSWGPICCSFERPANAEKLLEFF